MLLLKIFSLSFYFLINIISLNNAEKVSDNENFFTATRSQEALLQDECSRFGSCEPYRIGEFKLLGSCDTYFCKCNAEGLWKEYSCARHLVFNPIRRICDYPENIKECRKVENDGTIKVHRLSNNVVSPYVESTISSVKTDRCSKYGSCNDIGSFKSEGLCEKYFCKCSEEKKWEEYSCQGSLAFDAEKRTCEAPEANPGCKKENAIIKQTIVGSSKLHHNHDSHCKDFAPCQYVGEFKSHGDCHREFCECSSTRQWVVHLCTPPLAYNDETELCDWPRKIKKCYATFPTNPNPVSSIINTETSGQITSSIGDVDSGVDQSTSTVDRCGDIHGRLCKNVGEFRSQSRCGSRFCECSSTGKWVEHQCSGALAFNPRTEICEWQKDISECS